MEKLTTPQTTRTFVVEAHVAEKAGERPEPVVSTVPATWGVDGLEGVLALAVDVQ